MLRKVRNGNTTIELMMVMFLLVLFGLTVYQLIDAGSKTQARIINEKESQVNARIALSFVNVRLRQNDIKGKIVVKTNSKTNRDSIVIRERKEGIEYDTWIYFSGGKLLECIVEPDKEPVESLSSLIAELEDFKVVFDEKKNTFTNSIEYKYSEKSETNKTLQSIIHLRCLS